MQIKAPTQAEKIVEAACRLFGTQRFHEVRMDDVAAAADVGKGTLYRYFRDKEELYEGLLAHATAQFRARMHAEVDRASSARAQLEALVQAGIDYFDEHPHLKGLIQRAEAAHDEGDKPFVWNEARAEALRLIQEIFHAGQRNGEFEVHDPELAAMMLLGGIRAVVRDGAKPRASDLAGRVVEVFLCGAAAKAADQASGRKRPVNGAHAVTAQ